MRRSDTEFIADVALRAGLSRGATGVGYMCLVSPGDPHSAVACYAVVLTDDGVETIFEPGVGGTVAQAEEDLLSIVKRVHKKL